MKFYVHYGIDHDFTGEPYPYAELVMYDAEDWPVCKLDLREVKEALEYLDRD